MVSMWFLSREFFIMTEEEKPVEEKKEEEKPLSPLNEMRVLKEGNQKILDEMKEERAKFEEAKMNEILAGRAEAGQEAPKKETEDEKWAREAKERYKGTGLDPTPDDTPTTYI